MHIHINICIYTYMYIFFNIFLSGSAWGPPFFFRSANGAQSPRFRLPAVSVLARGFRRCCLGRFWVLIRSQGMPGARLEWGSGQLVGWMGRGKGLGVS